MRVRRTLIVGLVLVLAGAVVGVLLNAIAGVVVAVLGVGFALPAGGSDPGDGPSGPGPMVFPGGGGGGAGTADPGAS